ncbi:MAG: class I SAM-dependent methyltransferase [Propionibacteriaceae bacterium]
MRDYVKWHETYDDPASDLSWRLRQVQAYIRSALDQMDGQRTVLSLCAGDGRDVLQVLAERDDSSRIQTTLLELHPVLAQRARDVAAASGLANVTVRTVDAGNSTAYVGAVPADLVIMIGIFGNISDDDVRRTIMTAPQLCRTGATLLWSRATSPEDGNSLVRSVLPAAGFVELDYREFDSGEEERAALGSARYGGPPQPLITGQQLFTFVR